MVLQSQGRHPCVGWRPWSAPRGRGTATSCGGWVDTAPPLSGRGGQGHGVAREPARRHWLPCVTGSGSPAGAGGRPPQCGGRGHGGLLGGVDRVPGTPQGVAVITHRGAADPQNAGQFGVGHAGTCVGDLLQDPLAGAATGLHTRGVVRSTLALVSTNVATLTANPATLEGRGRVFDQVRTNVARGAANSATLGTQLAQPGTEPRHRGAGGSVRADA